MEKVRMGSLQGATLRWLPVVTPFFLPGTGGRRAKATAASEVVRVERRGAEQSPERTLSSTHQHL